MSSTESNLPLPGANEQPPAQAPVKAQRASAADNENALLAKYDFDRLDQVFQIAGDDGHIQQEREPCYQCMADGFYGRGTGGTWFMEGSIIVTEVIPNQFMKPLNRAAGLRFAKWLESLPQHSVNINMEDMAEASQMLAKNPQVKDLDPDSYQKALIDLCTKIKLKREGKDARTIPGIAHNFAPQSGGSAMPILGAKLSDRSQASGPGFNGAAAVPQPGSTRRASAALGGTPPGR